MMKILALVLTLLGAASVVRAEDVNPQVVNITVKNGSDLAFGSNAISNVRLSDNAEFNQIDFQLSEPIATEFSKLTSENVGNQIAISVCGEVISRPTVLSPIYGGGLALAGLEWERARELTDILSGRRLCN
ncbi:protein translocase subunit secD [Rhodovulum sulfidophilum]|uniref:Protein translocase subunit secD n=1 Tax=Rhodovulum sulfidophilum TaxID=35806 RepID=A0A0D6B175_RHOSU|nr:protein translocase subunit secD [Rhodovulum sulfidophilum]